MLGLGTTVWSLPAAAEGPAHADEPRSRSVELRYVADRTCPSEATFVSALRRADDGSLVLGGDAARRVVDVELRVLDTRARGRFRLVDRETGAAIERELGGPDCEAVGRAVALMLALALHDSAESPPPPASPPSPPEASVDRSLGSSEPRERPSALDPGASTQAIEPRARAPVEQPAASSTVPDRAAQKAQLSLDAQVAFTHAVVGELLPFASMTLALELPVLGLRPMLAIAIRQSLPFDRDVVGGEATFMWTSGAARLCPHVFGIGVVSVAPCLEAGLGVLNAEAHGLPGARASSELWSEGTGVLVARWHVAPRWFVGASASLTASLRRTRFELASGTLIFETPPLGVGLGLGAGLTL